MMQTSNTASPVRALATRPARGRRVIEVVERLRTALPVAIFLFVVLHQAWETSVIDSWAPERRFVMGVLMYGLVGPLVTFWTLDWIAKAMAARERIETRARRNERYLASITSNSADAIFSLDTDDVIHSWNRGAEELFGYRAAEIVGRHVGQLVPEGRQLRGELALIRDRMYADGYVRGFQTERLHKDGQPVPVDLTQTLLRAEDGEIVGSSVILRDITARREAEEAVRRLNRELEARVVERTKQLEAATEELRAKNEALVQANAELTQLDALKDEFVDLVSHELRAPLTNINASVELLLIRQPPDNTREKLEIIGHEASRLTRLVQGVLDVSRMRAGRLELQPAPVDAAELCRAAMRRVEDGDHVWQLDIAPDTPPVLADADRAVEVLGNLLDNAAKYSPAGSPVEIAVRPGPDDHVLFSVTDRGVGMPADELRQVFRRFHRVERGDARETYGHGLGLYIARRIVEAHDGRIWAESTPGEGSTFLFTLPRAPEEP